eukprot:scaffold283199_cov35-Attheya_sp.AAC.1
MAENHGVDVPATLETTASSNWWCENDVAYQRKHTSNGSMHHLGTQHTSVLGIGERRNNPEDGKTDEGWTE